MVFTGAGVSAESGIPTFRDAMNGLWSQYRAEDLATPQAFRANAKLVWKWYEWRRQLVAKARPNAALGLDGLLASRAREAVDAPWVLGYGCAGGAPPPR